MEKKACITRKNRAYVLTCSLIVFIFIFFLLTPSVMAEGTVTGSFSVPGIIISDIIVSDITSYGATITWTTDIASTSQVFYDTVTHENVADYAYNVPVNDTPNTTHSKNLTNLLDNTTYYYRIKVEATVEEAGYITVSDESSFQTEQGLNLTGFAVSNITKSGATISWNTNYDATSEVYYDTVSRDYIGDYTNTVTVEELAGLEHSYTFINFTASTTYYCRVKCTAIIGETETIASSAELSFTTSAATGGGGGGGGGGGAPTPGVTSIFYQITEGGVMTEDVTTYSGDRFCSVYLPKETLCVSMYGTALWEIRIIKMDPEPELPPEFSGLGLFYNMGVDGSQFKPAVTISFNYKNSVIPEGKDENDIVVAWRDADGKWNPVESTVDTETKIVSAQISHFTPYALLIPNAPPPVIPTTEPTVPSTTYPIIIPTTSPTVNPTNIPVLPTKKPATFSISNLKISPEQAVPGEKVTLSIQVQNSGDIAGNYEVVLKIDDAVAGRKILNLAARTKDEVSFKVNQENIGEYSIDINGIAGKFTVVDAGALPSSGLPSSNNNWIIIASIAVFTLSMVVTITVAWRKMRKT